MTCKETEGFSGERLELRFGRFRYWRYSDVESDPPTENPLEGSFRKEGNRIILVHDQFLGDDGVRVLDKVNGANVLWRMDGWRLWLKESRIHDRAILIETSSPILPFVGSATSRPSIYRLYTPEMTDREKSEFIARFSDQPPEVRPLLRADTDDLEFRKQSLRRELTKARETIDPRLVWQLVGLMSVEGDRTLRIRAERLLGTLYLGGWPIQHRTVVQEYPELSTHALTTLIESLAYARDRNALECTLGIFVVASGISEMDLTIPDAGIGIHIVQDVGLKYRVESKELEGSTVRPKSFRWKDEMGIIVPICQDWMRERIRRR